MFHLEPFQSVLPRNQYKGIYREPFYILRVLSRTHPGGSTENPLIFQGFNLKGRPGLRGEETIFDWAINLFFWKPLGQRGKPGTWSSALNPLSCSPASGPGPVSAPVWPAALTAACSTLWCFATTSATLALRWQGRSVGCLKTSQTVPHSQIFPKCKLCRDNSEHDEVC